MAVGDAYVFPGFLSPVLTQLFFPKPPTTFLACFCRGERRKYAGKKARLSRESNIQPPGYEPDTLTTEPLGRGPKSELVQKCEKELNVSAKSIDRVILRGLRKVTWAETLLSVSLLYYLMIHWVVNLSLILKVQ